MWNPLLLILPLSWCFAQPLYSAPLTVQQAVEQALANHPALRAGAAARKAAGSRVSEAQGARLPRVDFMESWTRSNNQVFVFGSLLTQKQFGAANFEIAKLNGPGFLNNFQSQLVVEQSVYDNGRRKWQIEAARLGEQMTAEQVRRLEMDVISGVLRCYYGAHVAAQNVRLAEDAVRTAEADLKRAEARLSAGMATEADALAVRVHVAAMRERSIRSRAELEIAKAALNEAMGLPLDTQHDLTTPLTKAEVEPEVAGTLESEAASNQPVLRELRLGAKAIEAQEKSARAALLPEAYFRAGFEADRQEFVRKGGANFLVSAGVRWNLFDGNANRARIDAAKHEQERTRQQEKALESAMKLAVRRAWLEVGAANERIEAVRAATAMARESLRIIRNRYDAGLTDVTELLRAQTALLETQTRELEALRDQRIAAVTLESARGRLSKDSMVVSR